MDSEDFIDPGQDIRIEGGLIKNPFSQPAFLENLKRLLVVDFGVHHRELAVGRPAEIRTGKKRSVAHPRIV